MQAYALMERSDVLMGDSKVIVPVTDPTTEHSHILWLSEYSLAESEASEYESDARDSEYESDDSDGTDDEKCSWRRNTFDSDLSTNAPPSCVNRWSENTQEDDDDELLIGRSAQPLECSIECPLMTGLDVVYPFDLGAEANCAALPMNDIWQHHDTSPKSNDHSIQQSARNDFEVDVPLDSDGEPTSIGSIGHAAGQCKVCIFHAQGTCYKGIECTFCHFKHSQRNNAPRLCKGKRDRMSKLLAFISKAIDKDPFDFDLDAKELPSHIVLPAFIASSPELKARLIEEVHSKVRDALLVRGDKTISISL